MCRRTSQAGACQDASLGRRPAAPLTMDHAGVLHQAAHGEGLQRAVVQAVCVRTAVGAQPAAAAAQQKLRQPARRLIRVPVPHLQVGNFKTLCL